jgi:hypothetical protein
MHYSEPITAITDYALGSVNLVFALLLWNHGTRKISAVLWSLGFVSASIAAFVGGTYHALKIDVDAAVLRAMWNATMFFIAVAGALMVSGVLTASGVGHASKKWLLRGLWLTLAGLAIQQSRFQFSAFFNHNDLFHCTQMVAFYFFFRGVRLSEDFALRR